MFDDVKPFKPAPAFALFRDDDGEELGHFVESGNLFVKRRRLGWQRAELTFDGGRLPTTLRSNIQDGLPRRLGNIWIGILNDAGATLGRYYLASATLVNAVGSAKWANLCRFELNGVFPLAPHPESQPLWKLWAEGQITERNEWAALRPGARNAWLEVARMRSASAAPKVDATTGATFDLDGTYVEDPVSFLCALGEAINGPGGYFGAGSDSLRDCLAGGFGARPPFVLRWHGAKPGSLRRRASKTQQALDELLGLLTATGVTILFVSPRTIS